MIPQPVWLPGPVAPAQSPGVLTESPELLADHHVFRLGVFQLNPSLTFYFLSCTFAFVSIACTLPLADLPAYEANYDQFLRQAGRHF
jgi:hypothetical protein